MTKPLVSVIMPVFNTERRVGEAVESILNQTFFDFEFIIVDDCSSDGSYELLGEYVKRDQRIKLVRNGKNQGISYTRNKLIKLATTNFICTQDSDDISEPKRMERAYDFLVKHEEYAVVSWNNLIIDEESRVIWQRKYSDNIPTVILKKSPISNPSAMFRKDCFLAVWGYEAGLNYGEDYDVWLKFALAGYKIKNLHYDLIRYRVRTGQSKSDKLKQTLRNTIRLQKKYMKLGLKASLSDRVYQLCEQCLLFVPDVVVLFLFQLREYKKWTKKN